MNRQMLFQQETVMYLEKRDDSTISVVENYADEAYDIFMTQTIHNGFRDSVEVNDSKTGEKITIVASAHLSKEQLEFLESLICNAESYVLSEHINFVRALHIMPTAASIEADREAGECHGN